MQLYCPDGFWSGDEPVVASRTFEVANPDPDEAVTFYKPFMSISSSRLVSGTGSDTTVPSATTVVNDGDVEAWPVWTLNGPFTKLTAVNLTSGARFSLTYNVAAGDTITITTNRPSVRDLAGVNRSRFIDWTNPLGTELWPLTPGANQISFIALGAGTGTRVQMAFTPRHETA
ncbi:phage distal tail protein [Actinoplanes xinjiangensis]|uniref:phage distal tail protein n=1 Tax=Actinoplanes xinjiangensis TaxID=512350 RepID=UPI0034189BC3